MTNNTSDDTNDVIVDLRSDTVTLPCAAMMREIQEARLGDDVYGEDPTVAEMQQTLAAMTGHESSLFFPSGTQSNLVALLTHCQRGDEYIVAQNAHTYKFEGGGAAALGGIQPQPIERGADGILDLEKVAAVIKEDDIHFAITRLLSLENTTSEGMAVPVEYFTEAKSLCQDYGLAMHLDGARVFNAATALGVDVSELTAKFDTVSICLSKGLGAPAGSALCGTFDFVERAKRWRKTVGGGMRQSGILAAAGLYALKNNVARLAEDHALASYLCEQLQKFDDVEIAHGGPQTNMVFFKLKSGKDGDLREFGKDCGILFGGRSPMRMVTHKDLARDDIDLAINRLSGFFD
jgi:threonine aldolase